MKKAALAWVAFLMLGWCVGCKQSEDSTQAAIVAYDAFLHEGAAIEQGDFTITIHPNHGSRYAIQDMNDDGLPELIVYQCIFRLRQYIRGGRRERRVSFLRAGH